MNIKTVSGNIVDVLNSEIYPGKLKITGDSIVDIVRDTGPYDTYIIPGFIDSHAHIESSMLVPSEFARAAITHGTVAAVADPHEIANVLGVAGVKYMIEDAKAAAMKIYFGAPSCVPATGFETSGAAIGPDQIDELMKMKEIKYLAEVMNFPGVINGDAEIMRKIAIAKKYSKMIDGHAPGLSGKDLEKYVQAGISTDHECFTKEEAMEKIGLGMKIQIREGSAAGILNELCPVLDKHYDSCMFCSDDKHPDDLVKGHINEMVKKALERGIDIMKVLMAACVNPVLHYGLDVGLLRKSDKADFLVIDNLKDFNILKTFINGEIVAEEGRPLTGRTMPVIINNFKAVQKSAADFCLSYNKGNIRVIEAVDGSLMTNKLVATPKAVDGNVVSDTDRDILKMAVVTRYNNSKPAIGFVKNFGLKKGAIASSIAHDSHNIIAVGVTDDDICRAVNLVIREKGGVSAVYGEEEKIIPLPVAGIMSDREYYAIAEDYVSINNISKSLGSPLHAPYMTLSFMALLVIPKIKMSDKGLFDGDTFQFIDIFE